jgi:smad nuclear-interacting protein 1
MSHQASGPSSRKRSRWANNQQPPSQAPPALQRPQVSDQDALQALLSSAVAKEEEQQQQESQQRRPHRGDRDNNRHHDKKARPERDSKPDPKNDYYGPADGQPRKEGALDASDEDEEDDEAVEKQKPNFGVSGALSKDMKAGNTYKGVVLKFCEPPEARAPNTLWRFYVFKGDEELETLHVSRQSAYLFGRNEEIADISLQHPSCSSQHAVLQYRALPNKETGKLKCLPYLMDLESTNGCFINGVRIDAARYYQLKKGDVVKFGGSTREYVLLTANTTSASK